MKKAILYTVALLTLEAATLFSMGCDPADAVDPGPDAGDLREPECQMLCVDEDEDILHAPAHRCPGTASDDTAYWRCVGECVSRMPDGYWCAPP